MSDAYNVRSDGIRYFVYRIDGNVQVAEYLGEGAAGKAQMDAARRNQRHNEQFVKKKVEVEPSKPELKDWVAEQVSGEVKKIDKKNQADNPPPGKGVSY